MTTPPETIEMVRDLVDVRDQHQRFAEMALAKLVGAKPGSEDREHWKAILLTSEDWIARLDHSIHSTLMLNAIACKLPRPSEPPASPESSEPASWFARLRRWLR